LHNCLPVKSGEVLAVSLVGQTVSIIILWCGTAGILADCAVQIDSFVNAG